MTKFTMNEGGATLVLNFASAAVKKLDSGAVLVKTSDLIEFAVVNGDGAPARRTTKASAKTSSAKSAPVKGGAKGGWSAVKSDDDKKRARRARRAARRSERRKSTRSTKAASAKATSKVARSAKSTRSTKATTKVSSAKTTSKSKKAAGTARKVTDW